MYCIACNSAHRLSKPCPPRLRHTYHQNPAARRLAIQRDLTLQVTLGRLAVAFERLLPSLQPAKTFSTPGWGPTCGEGPGGEPLAGAVQAPGEAAGVASSGGPLAGGGSPRHAVARLDSKPHPLDATSSCARLPGSWKYCGFGKLSSEIVHDDQIVTKKKTVRVAETAAEKRKRLSSMPLHDVGSEALNKWLVSKGIPTDHPDLEDFVLYWQSSGTTRLSWLRTWQRWLKSPWRRKKSEQKELPSWYKP